MTALKNLGTGGGTTLEVPLSLVDTVQRTRTMLVENKFLARAFHEETEAFTQRWHKYSIAVWMENVSDHRFYESVLFMKSTQLANSLLDPPNLKCSMNKMAVTGSFFLMVSCVIRGYH